MDEKQEWNKKIVEYRILEDFYLTDDAVKRIGELKRDNSDVFIRIMITSGGCAGHQYHILMDDYIGDADFVLVKDKNIKEIKQENVYVVVDEASLDYLHNSTMDFSDSLEFSGFTIDNPNITATCNCGNSFTCSGGFVMKKDDCKN